MLVFREKLWVRWSIVDGEKMMTEKLHLGGGKLHLRGVKSCQRPEVCPEPHVVWG